MSTPRKNKAFQHAAPTLGADFQRVDFQQAARRVEEVDEARCQHQEKWSFATRASLPPLRARMIALDELRPSSASKIMLPRQKMLEIVVGGGEETNQNPVLEQVHASAMLRRPLLPF